MRKNYLLPNYFKIIGWCMFLPFAILAICCLVEFDPIANFDFSTEISIIGLTLSLIFISLSREKDEDEYIEKIRLQSLAHSLIVSCCILIIGTLVFYDFDFFIFSLVIMFTLPFLFMIIFNIRLYKLRKGNNE